jgi:hypothetical protein
MLKVQSSLQNDRKISSAIIHRSFRFTARFIDYPSAFAGALIMGIIVFIINIRYGTWPATTAALKQAAYTFLFGGVIIRLLYFLVQIIPGKITSLVLSVFISSVVTISLVYLVHSMKGTPLPVESTLPTAMLAPPGFFFLAFRKKRQKSVIKRSAD